MAHVGDIDLQYYCYICSRHPNGLIMKMTSHQFNLIAFYCSAICLPLAAIAQDEFDHKSTGLVVILPALQTAQTDTNQRSTTALHLPGIEYKSGDDWRVLICESTCKIARTRLSVTPRQYSLQSGEIMSGQRLQWAPMPPGAAKLFFKTTASPLLLVAGPVKTYHPTEASIAARQNPAGTTTEVEFLLPDGIRAQLIPVLVRPNIKAAQSIGFPSLELRIGGQRQTLINGDFNPADFIVSPENYVIWAGDLDRDGKLDLIVKSSASNSCSANIVLLLSSLAKSGELVGEAGRFESLQNEGEGC